MSRHHPEAIFDDFSAQIMECHMRAVMETGITPELRSVMTWETAKRFGNSIEMQIALSRKPMAAGIGDEFEFRGSKVTIVHGHDIFFHTRCTNLP